MRDGEIAKALKVGTTTVERVDVAKVSNIQEHVEQVLPKPGGGGTKPEMLGGQDYRVLPTFSEYWLRLPHRVVADKVNGHQNGVDPVHFPQAEYPDIQSLPRPCGQNPINCSVPLWRAAVLWWYGAWVYG